MGEWEEEGLVLDSLRVRSKTAVMWPAHTVKHHLTPSDDSFPASPVLALTLLVYCVLQGTWSTNCRQLKYTCYELIKSGGGGSSPLPSLLPPCSSPFPPPLSSNFFFFFLGGGTNIYGNSKNYFNKKIKQYQHRSPSIPATTVNSMQWNNAHSINHIHIRLCKDIACLRVNQPFLKSSFSWNEFFFCFFLNKAEPLSVRTADLRGF